VTFCKPHFKELFMSAYHPPRWLVPLPGSRDGS
jgi:hypothetical protein